MNYVTEFFVTTDSQSILQIPPEHVEGSVSPEIPTPSSMNYKFGASIVY